MTTKTKTQDAAPVAEHNPEVLGDRAAQLEAEAREAREQADRAAVDIETARTAASVDYWRKRLTDCYLNSRGRFADAWDRFAATVREGDPAAIIATWHDYKRVRGQVAAEQEIILREARDAGLTGDAYPRVLGMEDSARKTFSQAFDMLTDQVEQAARAQRAAELETEVTALMSAAEAATRAGETYEPGTSAPDPAGVFICDRYPEIGIHDVAGARVKFNGGRAVVYEPEVADALREAIANGGLPDVTEVADEPEGAPLIRPAPPGSIGATVAPDVSGLPALE